MNAKVAILVIGDEVLSGHIHDSNSYYLAQELFKLGAELKQILTIPDEMNVIIDAVRCLKDRWDYLITTGGVGPTPDDKTRDAIAEVFDAPLELHPVAEEIIRAHYKDKIDEQRLNLGRVPKGAEVMVTNGTRLPFFRMENVYVLPGIPLLVEMMFPVIAERFRGDPIHTAEFITEKVESQFAHLMIEAEKLFPTVAIGSYPKIDQTPFTAKLLFKSRSEREAQRAADWLRERIEALE